MLVCGISVDAAAIATATATAAPRPRQGQELLTQGGEAPQFGDRYGALFENDQQVR